MRALVVLRGELFFAAIVGVQIVLNDLAEPCNLVLITMPDIV
jgi:hypothetical protein